MKTGFSLCSFSHRDKPVFITGIPANENRFFPVWENYTGKTPVLALYWPCTGLQWSSLYYRHPRILRPRAFFNRPYNTHSFKFLTKALHLTGRKTGKVPLCALLRKKIISPHIVSEVGMQKKFLGDIQSALHMTLSKAHVNWDSIWGMSLPTLSWSVVVKRRNVCHLF